MHSDSLRGTVGAPTGTRPGTVSRESETEMTVWRTTDTILTPQELAKEYPGETTELEVFGLADALARIWGNHWVWVPRITMNTETGEMRNERALVRETELTIRAMIEFRIGEKKS
jgi:hypothetical protein